MYLTLNQIITFLHFVQLCVQHCEQRCEQPVGHESKWQFNPNPTHSLIKFFKIYFSIFCLASKVIEQSFQLFILH